MYLVCTFSFLVFQYLLYVLVGKLPAKVSTLSLLCLKAFENNLFEKYADSSYVNFLSFSYFESGTRVLPFWTGDGLEKRPYVEIVGQEEREDLL